MIIINNLVVINYCIISSDISYSDNLGWHFVCPVSQLSWLFPQVTWNSAMLQSEDTKRAVMALMTKETAEFDKL